MKRSNFAIAEKLLPLLLMAFSTASLLPPKPKIVLDSEFNEAAEHQQYAGKLDSMLNRLEQFYSNFQSVRKETLGQIDSLTSLLTSQKSIDHLKSFVNSKINMDIFRNKIRDALKQKMVDEENSKKVFSKLVEYSNPLIQEKVSQSVDSNPNHRSLKKINVDSWKYSDGNRSDSQRNHSGLPSTHLIQNSDETMPKKLEHGAAAAVDLGSVMGARAESRLRKLYQRPNRYQK